MEGIAERMADELLHVHDEDDEITLLLLFGNKTYELERWVGTIYAGRQIVEIRKALVEKINRVLKLTPADRMAAL